MLNSDYFDMYISVAFRVHLKRSLLFLSTAAIVIAIDQLTKSLIRANMMLGESIPSQGRFRLSYSTNSGAVFGLSVDSTLLIVLSSATALIMLWLYFRFVFRSGVMSRLGLGLVLGGALGNLVDRFAFGEVTDFIDVRLWGDYHWPAFNVADAGVTMGVVLLIISLLFLPGYRQQDRAPIGNGPQPPVA